jgi:hypothetical protein
LKTEIGKAKPKLGNKKAAQTKLEMGTQKPKTNNRNEESRK